MSLKAPPFAPPVSGWEVLDKPLELFSGSRLLIPLAFLTPQKNLFDADMSPILNFHNLHVFPIKLFPAVSHFASQIHSVEKKIGFPIKALQT